MGEFMESLLSLLRMHRDHELIFQGRERLRRALIVSSGDAHGRSGLDGVSPYLGGSWKASTSSIGRASVLPSEFVPSPVPRPRARVFGAGTDSRTKDEGRGRKDLAEERFMESLH